MRNNILVKIRDFVLSRTFLLFTQKTGNKSIYLTFDDGPTGAITDKVLELLKKHDARATFFVIGKETVKHPHLMEKIVGDGHSVGNHSYTHPNFSTLDKPSRIKEIIDTNREIHKACSVHTSLFRAPRGKWTLPLMWQLKRLKMKGVHWSIDSLDHTKQAAQKIVSDLISREIQDGDIILFHDDNILCVDVLHILIPTWKAQGFTLAALDY